MRRRTRNLLLKGTTAAAAVLYVLAACCLDSESNVPLIVCGVCAAWLALFAVANTR